jgi:hypothetical protein
MMVLACAVVCAGCRLDANVTVKVVRDGSGVVTVHVIADKDLIGRAGNALVDLRLDDATNAGWVLEGPADTPEGGRQLALSKPFRTQAEADRILAELSGPSGPFHQLHLDQKRAFAKITTKLTGEVGLDGGAAGLGDSELVQLLGGRQVLDGTVGANLTDQLVVTVKLNGPGNTVGAAEATGPMDGATRTPVALQSVERDDLASRARTKAYVAVTLAIAVAALVFYLMKRRRLAAKRRQLVWRR